MIYIEGLLCSSNSINGEWKFKFSNEEKIVPFRRVGFVVYDIYDLYDVIDPEDFVYIIRKDTGETVFDRLDRSQKENIKYIEDD